MIRILDESGCGGEGRCLADAAGWEWKRAALLTRWVGRGGWAQAMISWMGRTCSTPTSF